jgi:hypothetical protein
VDEFFEWPDDGDPACRRCGAVVSSAFIDKHREWHESLLYLATTLVTDLGRSDLLSWASQL